MTGDVILSKGYGAFGCRLRRLSERIDREVKEIFQSHSIYFDPCWFPIIAALQELGPQTLNELATSTGLGSGSLGQIKVRLLGEGLISVGTDERDQRRQKLHLTAKCRQLIFEANPIWAALSLAVQGVCAESAPEFLRDMEVVEAALNRRRLSTRVRTIMDRSAAP